MVLVIEICNLVLEICNFYCDIKLRKVKIINERIQSQHHLANPTTDLKMSGRFVMMPSTPISIRRIISERESTVQT